jgi:hypothetical protein
MRKLVCVGGPCDGQLFDIPERGRVFMVMKAEPRRYAKYAGRPGTVRCDDFVTTHPYEVETITTGHGYGGEIHIDFLRHAEISPAEAIAHLITKHAKQD